MKKIKLTQNKYAIVDDEDFEFLNRFKWRVGIQNRFSKKIITVIRRVFIQKNNKKIPYDLAMENYILPEKVNMIILHKNKDWLDFRKENLIYGSHSLLKQTSTKAENKSSKYKGVSLQQRGSKTNPWRGSISIRINGKRETYRINVPTEKEAGIWYNKKAIELFGDNAYQNIID